MGEVEINTAVIVNAEAHMDTDLEDCAGSNIAGNKIAVCRVHLLEKIPRLSVLIRPDAPALAAACFRHETVLI